MLTKSTASSTDVKVLQEVLPQANGKEISFIPNQGAFYASTFLNPYNLDYGNSTYQIDRIVFYDAEAGEEVIAGRGWFSLPRQGNNPYKSMALLDKGENAHISRRNGDAATHFHRGDVFIQSRGRDWSKTLLADLYIPMTYLDAMGWEMIQTTFEGDYETHTSTAILVAPSAGAQKSPLFALYHSSETVKHFEAAKRALIDTLQNATDKHEVRAVMDEFKWKF